MTRPLRRWPVVVVAVPASIAVWSGWIGLGVLCGFGVIQPLPGLLSFHLNTVFTLPVGVEAYGAYALGAWLHPATPAAARQFAGRSATGSLLLGMAGQVAYHLLAAAHAVRAPWPVVTLVSCLPVLTLGAAVALTHMLRAEQPGQEAAIVPAGQSASDGLAEQPPDGRLEQPSVSQPSGHPNSQEAAIPATASQPPQQPAEQPQRQPASQPRRRAAAIDNGHEAKAARKRYRQSVRDGAPLSDRALGELFSQTRYWGEKRIAEVKAEPALAEAQ